MTIYDDILAVLESSRLPLTMSDLVYDVSNMPVARGEPRRNVKSAEVAAEIKTLVQSGKVLESVHPIIGYGTELVYRMHVEKQPTQRMLL